MASITRLASLGGEEWRAFVTACNQLGDEGDYVKILSHSRLVTHLETGQRIRSYHAHVRHPSGLVAEATIHIGFAGDMIYTGYSEHAFCDSYSVTLPSRKTYTSRLWRADNEAGPFYVSWQTVAPIRMAIWWAICARMFANRSVIGDPDPIPN